MLQEEGSFSESVAKELLDSYEILTRYRVMLQVKVIKGIQKDSYFLDPLTLDHNEREGVRQAIIKVEELQKMIHMNFNIV